VADDELERRDYEALLATRGELGPDYDKALVESFADRMEREIERRSFHGNDEWRARRDDSRGDRQRQLALAIVSLGGGIPITAVSASISGLPGLITSWAGISAVNLAHAWVIRRRD
jgi:hypothetical protein